MNSTITEKQERFLDLRSQGKTYDQIASALGVSRRTLFYWNQQLGGELAFEETAQLETLHQELLGTREARARRLARRLAAIEDELDKRSLADLSTARLFSLADSLRRQLTKETTPQRPGRANFLVSPDQVPPLPAPSIQKPIKPPIQPSAQCNDSAIPVQPTLGRANLPPVHRPVRRSLPVRSSFSGGGSEVGSLACAPKLQRRRGEGGVSPDQAPPLPAPPIQESNNPSTQSPNKPPIQPSAQCNDSAITVQPENKTPSPLPTGEKEGMRGPFAHPASSSVGSSIQESNNPPIHPPAQCNDSAIPVQPDPGRANFPVSPDQTPSLPAPPIHSSRNPSIQSPNISSRNPSIQPSAHSHIEPISPERLLGPNINFREALERARREKRI